MTHMREGNLLAASRVVYRRQKTTSRIFILSRREENSLSLAEKRTNLYLHWPLTGAPDTLLHTIPNKLPTEYQEIEYLESTGTQYIDTGIVASMNTKVEFIYRFTSQDSASAVNALWGSMPSASSTTPRIGIGQNVATGLFIGINSTEVLATANTEKHNLIFDVKNGKTYYDATTHNNSGSGASPSLTSYLFARHGSSGVQAYGNVIIWRYREWANNIQVRNCIPCYRKSDNKTGMYDLVSNTFLANAGSSEFICGPLIKSIPNTYLPLEYIESTGTQEIRNNIAIAANSILKTAVMATGDITAEKSFVGASSSFEWYFKNSQIQIWKNAIVANTTYPINAQINTKYELTMKNTAAESNVSLFGYNGSSYRFIGRMYYFITTNSSGLTTHDMRPVLRVSDKKPGMYDLVTDIFYVNAGTGEFVYPAYNIEYDISGNHHDGTILNAPTIEFDTVRYKNIMHITATNQKVKATGITTSSFQNAYTIAWWANFASGQSTAMHWGFSGGTRLNGLYTNGTLWNTGDGSNNPIYAPGTTTQLSSNASLAGQWHHWVMTGNGTKCYLYKDGELYGEAKTYKALNCSNVDFYINGWDSGTTYCSSNSKYSDLRIYSAALSATEVKELYDMGRLS